MQIAYQLFNSNKGTKTGKISIILSTVMCDNSSFLVYTHKFLPLFRVFQVKNCFAYTSPLKELAIIIISDYLNLKDKIYTKSSKKLVFQASKNFY